MAQGEDQRHRRRSRRSNELMHLRAGAAASTSCPLLVRGGLPPRSSLAEASVPFAGRTGSLLGRAGSLRGRIGSLRGRTGSLRGGIESLRGRIGSLRGRIGSLLGRAGSLRGRIGSLRGQLVRPRASPSERAARPRASVRARRETSSNAGRARCDLEQGRRSAPRPRATPDERAGTRAPQFRVAGSRDEAVRDGVRAGARTASLAPQRTALNTGPGQSRAVTLSLLPAATGRRAADRRRRDRLETRPAARCSRRRRL